MASNASVVLNELDDQQVKVIETTYNQIKVLEEEKKSIAEDIRDEKQKASKETGVAVKDMNSIFKLLKMREKGFDQKLYDNVINKILGE